MADGHGDLKPSFINLVWVERMSRILERGKASTRTCAQEPQYANGNSLTPAKDDLGCGYQIVEEHRRRGEQNEVG